MDTWPHGAGYPTQTASPLDVVTDRIRERVQKRGEDWLVATHHVVSIATDRQARLVYDALAGKLLTIHEADLAQIVAQRLGIAITWRHIDLAPGSQWEEGRGS